MSELKLTSSQSQLTDTPENWDAASAGYAEKVAPYLMESFAQDHIDRLDVNGKSETLEVAAGSGALTGLLAQNVRCLLATDFSPGMIEQLKKKITGAGLRNVEFDVMDGQALDVYDASFDRAACSFALMLFPDRHKGFRELNRILRPGGRAVVSGWAGPERFQAFGLFMEAIGIALPDLPKPSAPPPVLSLADPASFKSQMETGGFKKVEVEFVEKELVLNDFKSMWDMLTVGAPPIQKIFDQVGADGKDRIHDALANIIDRRFGNGPISITNTATFGRGLAA